MARIKNVPNVHFFPMAVSHDLVLRTDTAKDSFLFSIWKCLHTVRFSPKCNILLSTSVLPSTGKVSNYVSADTVFIYYWTQTKTKKKKVGWTLHLHFPHKNCMFVCTFICTDTRNLSLVIFCRDQLELKLDSFHEDIFQPKVRYSL